MTRMSKFKDACSHIKSSHEPSQVSLRFKETLNITYDT